MLLQVALSPTLTSKQAPCSYPARRAVLCVCAPRGCRGILLVQASAAREYVRFNLFVLSGSDHGSLLTLIVCGVFWLLISSQDKVEISAAASRPGLAAIAPAQPFASA